MPLCRCPALCRVPGNHKLRASKAFRDFCKVDFPNCWGAKNVPLCMNFTVSTTVIPSTVLRTVAVPWATQDAKRARALTWSPFGARALNLFYSGLALGPAAVAWQGHCNTIVIEEILLDGMWPSDLYTCREMAKCWKRSCVRKRSRPLGDRLGPSPESL